MNAIRQALAACWRAGPAALAWAAACGLLAVAQTALAGYRFGFGNQAIQIAFLKRMLAPGLYPGDPLLDTLADYPTRFFHVLAALARSPAALPDLYFALHLGVAAATLGAAAALGYALFRRRAGAWLAMALLVAGHHAGLGEANLYSPGLTHTWFAFPLSLAALAASLAGRHALACGLAAALFPIHALAALGVAALALGALAGDWREVSAARLGACLALLAAGAMPLVAGASGAREAFDATWLALLRVRSEHHVFPSSWWQPGAAQAPRFALLMGFLALAVSATPPAVAARRRLLPALGAGAALMAAGVVFGEVAPWPAVLRAQPFRVTRLLVPLALAAVAGWSTAAAREAVSGSGRTAWRWLRAANAVSVAAALAVPGLESWWPALLASSALLELWGHRLAWWAAASAGVAGGVAVLAWGRIGFSLAPAWTGLGAGAETVGTGARAGVAWGAATPLAAGLACGLLAAGPWRARWMPLLALLAAPVLWSEARAARLRGDAPATPAERHWRDVQRFARAHTATNAVFLVPPRVGGFRVRSERAVVGEWRDGTQQFFSPSYALEWWRRMKDLEPGLEMDAATGRLTARGTALEDLAAEDLIALCDRYHARYVVLPAVAPTALVGVYSNAEWRVARPELPPPPPVPEGIVDTNAWRAQAEFMARVVLPNIEKHRKGEAVIRLSASGGRPLQDAPYRLTQTTSAFGFGSGLPLFRAPPPGGRPDFDPGVVDARELDAFRRLLNFSVISYSGKWNVMEPVEGQPSYEDLDRYVGWCVTNGVTPEFHFVTGYEPAWVKAQPAEGRQASLLTRTRALVERYGDRIPYWQVVNEKHLMNESVEAFRLIRSLRPELKLGIADCARFHAWTVQGRRMEDEMLRGMREVRWLRDRGVALDFFGFHGHRPFGLWPDARTMYEALDAFAAEGLRIHVTEIGAHGDMEIIGPLRRGRMTPELQAEYYRHLFTVCFSHPAVDVVNLWGIGPRTWMRGAGLVDGNFAPKPAYEALRRLIREEWRTRLEGRTPLDGRLAFRGFHGDYELSVTPDGEREPVSVGFALKPGITNRLEFVWDAAARRLRAVQAQ